MLSIVLHAAACAKILKIHYSMALQKFDSQAIEGRCGKWLLLLDILPTQTYGGCVAGLAVLLKLYNALVLHALGSKWLP